ncbi:unnamed protein product [Paramecium octaurelia]|uniref:Uncharacterized protein n=1 Tax=Paramecium octaurelia TaxID=43137 RepID=A0A8S1YGF8_PAROT|nr:unnamed protein product [Paramecium octaurelia]CAD8211867.1 unnamed protein product [Paramecium octaurelia]
MNYLQKSGRALLEIVGQMHCKLFLQTIKVINKSDKYKFIFFEIGIEIEVFIVVASILKSFMTVISCLATYWLSKIEGKRQRQHRFQSKRNKKQTQG